MTGDKKNDQKLKTEYDKRFSVEEVSGVYLCRLEGEKAQDTPDGVDEVNGRYVRLSK